MKLDDYIAQKGITATEFARRSGVPQPTLSRILRGERRASDALKKKIFEATGGEVTPNDFVLGDNSVCTKQSA